MKKIYFALVLIVFLISLVTATGVYNPSTGKCEIYPEKQINCPGGYAYDLPTDKCVKYPDLRTICPIGTTYNLVTDKCEYTPPTAYICQVGFTYNPSTGRCELKPAEQIICGIGTYDPIKNVCVYEPQPSPVCNKGALTYLGNGNYACVYTPESIANCPTGTTYDISKDKCVSYPSTSLECPMGTVYNSATGFCEGEIQILCVQGTYDSIRKACVYSPNMEYLCLQGTLIYENGIAKCTIVPESAIVCAAGWTYNSATDRCEKYPDYWISGIAGEIGKIDWQNIWDNYKWWIIIGGGIALLLLLIPRKR